MYRSQLKEGIYYKTKNDKCMNATSKLRPMPDA